MRVFRYCNLAKFDKRLQPSGEFGQPFVFRKITKGSTRHIFNSWRHVHHSWSDAINELRAEHQ